MLTSTDFENFYIRLYFGNLSEGFHTLAIKRAYLDFSRTLRDFKLSPDKKENFKKNWHSALSKGIADVIGGSFKDQNAFDDWHKKNTLALATCNENFPLTIGQSQKWINMTLKYLLLFGDNRINGITKNHRYFHVPIDNIIMKIMKEKYDIKELSTRWSRIRDYELYYKYQLCIRAKIYPENPFETELRLFNQSKNTL